MRLNAQPAALRSTGQCREGRTPSPDKQSQQEAPGVDQQAGGSRCGRCVLAGSEGLFAVGFASPNSDIRLITFEPAPKDAGAAPVSFVTGLNSKVIRQIAEFSDTNPTANGPISDSVRVS